MEIEILDDSSDEEDEDEDDEAEGEAEEKVEGLDTDATKVDSSTPGLVTASEKVSFLGVYLFRSRSISFRSPSL